MAERDEQRLERVDATEVRLGEPARTFSECLVQEQALEICMEGKHVAMQWRTPGRDAELAAGFCLTAGLVSRDAFRDNGIRIAASERRVDVQAPEGAPPPPPGGRIHTPEQAMEHIPPVESGVTVTAEHLWAMHRDLVDNQRLWNATGGAHAAGLFRPDGELIVVREDVGRHNALDKVIGYCLLNSVIMRECVLALSCRATFEMALKAARAGFSVVACVSAATSTAVHLCSALNITIAGFVRRDRMVVYTYPSRIVPD